MVDHVKRPELSGILVIGVDNTPQICCAVLTDTEATGREIIRQKFPEGLPHIAAFGFPGADPNDVPNWLVSCGMPPVQAHKATLSVARGIGRLHNVADEEVVEPLAGSLSLVFAIGIKPETSGFLVSIHTNAAKALADLKRAMPGLSYAKAFRAGPGMLKRIQHWLAGCGLAGELLATATAQVQKTMVIEVNRIIDSETD